MHLLQGRLTALAEFLGEKKDSDPAALFVLLHNFAKMFDTALVQVAKRTKQLEDIEGHFSEDPKPSPQHA